MCAIHTFLHVHAAKGQQGDEPGWKAAEKNKTIMDVGQMTPPYCIHESVFTSLKE